MKDEKILNVSRFILNSRSDSPFLSFPFRVVTRKRMIVRSASIFFFHLQFCFVFYFLPFFFHCCYYYSFCFDSFFFSSLLYKIVSMNWWHICILTIVISCFHVQCLFSNTFLSKKRKTPTTPLVNMIKCLNTFPKKYVLL